MRVLFVNVEGAEMLISLFEVWWLGALGDVGSWEPSTIDQLLYQVCNFCVCVCVCVCVCTLMLKEISFPEEHKYLVFCVHLKGCLNTHTQELLYDRSINLITIPFILKQCCLTAKISVAIYIYLYKN